MVLMESSSNLLRFEVLAESNDKVFFASSLYRQVDRWRAGIYLPRKKDGSGWINHEATKYANLYAEITYQPAFNPTIMVINSHGDHAWECDTISNEAKSVVVRWSGFVFMIDIATKIFSVRKINVIPHGLEVSVVDKEIYREELVLSPHGRFLVENLNVPENSFLNDEKFATELRWMCSIASHQHRSLVKSKTGIGNAS
jgi:hypothetical protein